LLSTGEFPAIGLWRKTDAGAALGGEGGKHKTGLEVEARRQEGVAAMRKLTTILVPIAACSLVLAAGQATGAPSQSSAIKTVSVVMKDPGCHWFSVGGKVTMKMNLSVKGPVALANYDEAALKIVGPTGVKHVAVAKKITLMRGSYRITMVGQHPDDNTLRLVVS